MTRSASLAVIKNQLVNDNKPTWYTDDVWLYQNLGINGKQADRHVTFSFKHIHQYWLKEVTKQYIFYCSINKSCHFVNSSVSGLILFSNYLHQLHEQKQPMCLDAITRELMIGYFSYLSQKKLSAVTRQTRIVTLSGFLDTCCERGWMNYQGKLIYAEDIPRRPKTLPRFIPQSVLQQLNQHLDQMDPHIRRLILVLQETGMRINEVIKLPFDCIYQDSDGDYFLKYFQSKMNKEHVIPVSLALADEIKAQQQSVQKEWGAHTLLFVVPTHIQPFKPNTRILKAKNRGMQWIRKTLSRYLNRFAEYHQIKSENGEIWRFEFHQFRHTVATQMINNDVPQHIVQRFLGHESPSMTARYAYVIDQTLKKAFTEFNNKMVNITGEVVTSKDVVMTLAEGTSPEDIDARWLKKHIMAQALPNGTCALPVVSNSCPHSNACLTCANFRTDHRYLLTHKQQLEKTKVMIAQAEKNGWQRQLEMNTRIQSSLEKIITTLESSNHDTPA